MRHVRRLLATAIALTILISVVIVYNLSHQEPFIYEFLDADTKLILLKEDQTFNGVNILDWQYEKNYEPDPKQPTFYTQDQDYIPLTEIEIIPYLEEPYEIEILKVKNTEKIRLNVPRIFYKIEDGITYKYETTYLKVKLDITETNYFFTAKADFEPEVTYEYVIITNGTFWNIFNQDFKQWKIDNDPKIGSDSIWIVNVSYITSGIGCAINGTYSDSVNESGENPWIPDGKEINQDYELFNDTQAQIRNFIRRCVSLYGTKWVLLGGNKNIVPPRMVCSNASGDECSSFDSDQSHACDMYYGCLHYSMNNNTNSYWMENECCGRNYDEIDWGFDVLVGRACCGTEQELHNWINKTKAYVEGNDDLKGEYLKSNMNACKDGSYDISNQTWTGWWEDEGIFGPGIGDEFPSNMSWVNNKNITQAQWILTDEYVSGNVSDWDGINIIYHAGHGGTLFNVDGGTYQPTLCRNALIPQFVYTEGCHSGDFGTDVSSRAEIWMSYNGTYSMIANSAYGWFVASTFFGEDMFSRMFNETRGILEPNFCQAHFDSRETEGHSAADGVFAMIFKETNFFGDPAQDWIWYQEGYSPSTKPPQIISIDSNANRTTISNSTPTFNWTIMDNASQYHLLIATDSSFTSLVVNLTNISEALYPTYYSENETNVSFILPSEYELSGYDVYYVKVKAYVK